MVENQKYYFRYARKKISIGSWKMHHFPVSSLFFVALFTHAKLFPCINGIVIIWNEFYFCFNQHLIDIIDMSGTFKRFAWFSGFFFENLHLSIPILNFYIIFFPFSFNNKMKMKMKIFGICYFLFLALDIFALNFNCFHYLRQNNCQILITFVQ